MDDSTKKNCGTCVRKISASNKHFVKDDLVRDGKIWCGACEINRKYISYPEHVEYYDNSTVIFKKKPEIVPSSPPWTTWSGILMCDEDSDMGRKIRESDPNAEPGYLMIEKKKIPIPGKVRGLWTAPETGKW
jgi:hypothetical protein